MTLNSTLTSIISCVAAIGTVLGLWWNIETKLEEAIAQSTDLITRQIVHDATQLAELHITDLEVRVRILKREIASYGGQHNAPERMYILLDALQSQIQETKDKTW